MTPTKPNNTSEPIPKAAAINICLIKPANLLRDVAKEIETILFLKYEFIRY